MKQHEMVPEKEPVFFLSSSRANLGTMKYVVITAYILYTEKKVFPNTNIIVYWSLKNKHNLYLSLEKHTYIFFNMLSLSMPTFSSKRIGLMTLGVCFAALFTIAKIMGALDGQSRRTDRDWRSMSVLFNFKQVVVYVTYDLMFMIYCLFFYLT